MAEDVNRDSGTSLLWNRLKAIQSQAFPELKGLFPSFRYHSWAYRRKDNSAYFTATLIHSLSRLALYFSEEEKAMLEDIRQNACQGVAPFQNKQGLERYNFWKTHPADHFPNGWILGRWEHFRPPDDADDSVMIYLMQNQPRKKAAWLMQHIDSYANGKRKQIKNTPPEYRELGAWCTFFCLDMPLGFDACVISNILYFNRFYQFEENEAYCDSLEYLCRMIRQRDHLKRPEKVSPYYPRTSIILYHLSKLMSSFSVPELEVFRYDLSFAIEAELGKSENQSERLMLENAWMWMNHTLPEPASKEISKTPFYFFVLPLTLEYEGWFYQTLAHKRWSHLRFSCEALEIAFGIENQVLRRSISGAGLQ